MMISLLLLVLQQCWIFPTGEDFSVSTVQGKILYQKARVPVKKVLGLHRQRGGERVAGKAGGGRVSFWEGKWDVRQSLSSSGDVLSPTARDWQASISLSVYVLQRVHKLTEPQWDPTSRRDNNNRHPVHSYRPFLKNTFRSGGYEGKAGRSPGDSYSVFFHSKTLKIII